MTPNYLRIVLVTFCIVVTLSILLNSTLSESITPHFENIVENSGVEKLGHTNGASWVDYDNDGYDDLFLAGGAEGAKLYKNVSGNRFIDVSPEEFRILQKSKAGVFADYDNDGCQDLLSSELYLFKGDCSGNFKDVTKQAGLNIVNEGYKYGIAWADYNNDGYLDFYIAVQGKVDFQRKTYETQPNIFFKNNGDGTFTDVSHTSGATGAAECAQKDLPHGLEKSGLYKQNYQPVWFDYNNDNLIDLFIATHLRGVSPLYKNNGDGTFTDVTYDAGMCLRNSNMGVTVGDYNNDGYLDLYTTNIRGNYFWINQGNGKFLLGAQKNGTSDRESVGWGTGFLDYDSDGYLDLYVVNGFMRPTPNTDNTNVAITREDKLFRNLGNGMFREVSKEVQITGDYAKVGSAMSDYDRDGFTDIISIPAPVEDIPIRFYDNGGNGNNWVAIKLTGTKSNKDSIGARITVTTGNKKQIREVGAGTSFLSQNSLWQIFGVGQSDIIDRVEILWPSGRVKALKNVKPKQRLVISEPN